jgi:4-amino-4-deoxy-L-arabinose transferase-like glycosyltransferase
MASASTATRTPARTGGTVESETSTRIARVLRRTPPALGSLMAVSLLLAVTWATVVPAFQAPDEQSHFTYVQSLATGPKLPGDPERPFFSTQMGEAISAVNSDQVASQIRVKPEWSERVEEQWAATEEQAPRDDGGGASPASNYPPTAYAWQALGYIAASSGTVFDELLGARLMSALWLPITVLGTWLLAGEVLGPRRLLQTAAAAVPALAPMVAFITASSSPDGMLYAVWTLTLWLGVRCVKRGVPLRDGIAFFALVGLACTIKTVSFALLVPAALVLGMGLVARRPWRARTVLAFVAAAAVPIALTLGIWALVARAESRPAAAQVAQSTASTSGTNWRELLSYVWQYYLPRTPLQNEFRIPPGGYPLLQVWITQAWGAFGWLEIKFPPMVYRVLAVLTGGIGLAAIAALVRARRNVDLRVAGFLVLACLALLAGLHWTDYHQLKAGALGFMQARYLFPVIGVLGLGLAAAVSLVPRSWRGAVTGSAVGGLFVFHLFALGLVLERFYA